MLSEILSAFIPLASVIGFALVVFFLFRVWEVWGKR